MKGKTKRYDADGVTHTAAIREIAGNYYLVIVRPDINHVVVYGDLVDGSEMDFPKRPEHFSIDLDTLVRQEVGSDSLSNAVAVAVNEAVGVMTQHLEQTKSIEDEVLGALEANAEVHEE